MNAYTLREKGNDDAGMYVVFANTASEANGEDEGYKEYSEKWHKCGTSCKFCAEEDNQ